MLTLLQHEISRVLRSGRCFALVLAGVGAVAVGLGLAWPGHATRGADATLVASAFLGMLLWSGYACIIAFAADAIAGERQRETLELLHASPISPLSHLVAKAAAVFVTPLLLLVGSLPLGMGIYLLGGLSFEQILSGFAIVAATWVSAAVAGLLCSAPARTTTEAALRALGLVVVWNLGPMAFFAVPAVAVFQQRRIRKHALYFELSLDGILSVLSRTWAILLTAGFILAFLAAILDRSASSPFDLLTRASPALALQRSLGNPLEARSLAQLQLVLSLAVVVFCAFRIQRLLRLEETRTGIPAMDSGFAARLSDWARDWTELQDPRRGVVALLLLQGAALSDDRRGNAIFAREIRFGFPYGIRAQRWLLVTCTLLTGIFATIFEQSLRLPWSTILCAIVLGGFTFLLPAVAALLLAGEIEGGSLDQLRSTSLTAGEIVLGKWKASLGWLTSWAAIPVSFLALRGLFRVVESKSAWADELGSIFLALALLVSSALLASAGGMAAGLMLRRTVPALMTAEAITAGPWILAPIFLSIYVPGSGLSSWISPFAATASLFEGAADQRNSLAPAGCAVLHLGAGLAFLAWLRRKLSRGE